MRNVSAVLCAIFLMIISMPVASVGHNDFGPDAGPMGLPQMAGGVTPTVGWNETSFTFWLNYSDVDNDPPDWVKVNVSGVDYDMYENDTSDTNYTDGKSYYWMNEERLWSKGIITYFFKTYSNGTEIWTSTGTFEILNRKPYILEPPPTRVYVGVVVEYVVRVQDDDLDPIFGELTDHNFTGQDWEWIYWYENNRTLRGKPAQPFIRFAEVTIWDSYNQTQIYSWRITCTNQGGSPPGGDAPKGTPFPRSAGATHGLLLDWLR